VRNQKGTAGGVVRSRVKDWHKKLKVNRGSEIREGNGLRRCDCSGAKVKRRIVRLVAGGERTKQAITARGGGCESTEIVPANVENAR